MNREFLTTLGISEDIVDKIMTEHGKGIESTKTKYGDYDTIKSQLDTANKQIEEFGKLDFDGLKKSADEYKTKFETAQADSEKQLNDLKFNHALDGALTGAKARNSKAVKALLDLDGLKITKDGEVVGLNEQIEKIKTENAYMFDSNADDTPKFLSSVNALDTATSNSNPFNFNFTGLGNNKKGDK